MRILHVLDHSLPLLEMLKPLRPDADDESTISMRALVRSALSELVGELGNVGGPRVQRVNEYFTRLLGVTQFDVAFFQTQAFVDLDQGRCAAAKIVLKP